MKFINAISEFILTIIGIFVLAFMWLLSEPLALVIIVGIVIGLSNAVKTIDEKPQETKTERSITAEEW